MTKKAPEKHKDLAKALSQQARLTKPRTQTCLANKVVNKTSCQTTSRLSNWPRLAKNTRVLSEQWRFMTSRLCFFKLKEGFVCQLRMGGTFNELRRRRNLQVSWHCLARKKVGALSEDGWCTQRADLSKPYKWGFQSVQRKWLMDFRQFLEKVG